MFRPSSRFLSELNENATKQKISTNSLRNEYIVKENYKEKFIKILMSNRTNKKVDNNEDSINVYETV